MTRAPLAHASRQSRWHCLRGCTSPFPSVVGEESAALSLTPTLRTMLWRQRTISSISIYQLDSVSFTSHKKASLPHLCCRGRKLLHTNLHINCAPWLRLVLNGLLYFFNQKMKCHHPLVNFRPNPTPYWDKLDQRVKSRLLLPTTPTSSASGL